MTSDSGIPPRVVARVKSKLRESESGCWLFTGALRPDGYAQIGWNVAPKTPAFARIHRLMWTVTYGAIPDGMDLDHVCHDPKVCPGGPSCIHRSCANPAHLRLATSKQNAANRRPRGFIRTHCPHGHPYDELNTRLNKYGKRVCRACERDRDRARYWRTKDAA